MLGDIIVQMSYIFPLLFFLEYIFGKYHLGSVIYSGKI